MRRLRSINRCGLKASWCYDVLMRTTIDLPEDLHELARQLAHDGSRSMSSVIAELIRRGLGGAESESRLTKGGMPQVSVGRPITAEDVRSLDDDA